MKALNWFVLSSTTLDKIPMATESDNKHRALLKQISFSDIGQKQTSSNKTSNSEMVWVVKRYISSDTTFPNGVFTDVLPPYIDRLVKLR